MKLHKLNAAHSLLFDVEQECREGGDDRLAGLIFHIRTEIGQVENIIKGEEDVQ